MSLRMLLSSTNSIRHLFPMIAFARVARRAGHTVGFLVSPGMEHTLRHEQFDMITIGPGALSGPDVAIADLTAMRGCGLNSAEDGWRWFAGTRVDHFVDQAISAVADWRPDLIVHEMHDFVGSMTATALGVVSAVVATGPAITGPAAERMTEYVGERHLSRGLRPPVNPPGYAAGAWYLDTCPPSLQVDGWHPHSRVLALRPELYRAGPTPRPIARPLGSPRVLVTFGACVAPPTTLSTLLRRIASLDVEVIATVGAEVVPDTDDFGSDRIKLVQGIPLAELLGDVAAVVTRGCSGSSMLALNYGVPMVIIPEVVDHVTPAERIAAAGAGIALRAEDASTEAVVAAVRRVLGSPSVIGSARRIADEIADMPSAEEVIETLVKWAY